MDTSKQMPNLMGAAHGAADGNRRILAQLEHGPKATGRPARAWRPDGWAIGLVVLLLTVGGVAWLMHEETMTPVSFKRHAGGSRTAAGKQGAMAAVAPAAPVAMPAAQSAPAAIVNEPRLQAAGPLTAQRLAQQAGVRQPAAARARPARAATTRRPGQDTPPAPVSDTDITLLTALVAHAGKPASVAPERSRDVVERADGVPTAELLARCRQLGMMEGMLCRSRICSGPWEADPACRASAN